MMTTTETATDLPEPTKEQLLDYITHEWMCVMYGEDSLLSKVLANFDLDDSDGTRIHLRAMLSELTREGRITCDNRPWKDRKGVNQHQSQCRLVKRPIAST
jgi:hypothetical protein